MLNILLNGCNGKLSRAVIEYCETRRDARVIAGIDPAPVRVPLPFPVFKSAAEVDGIRPDVVLDCSLPKVLPGLLELALRERLPLVIATTGYCDGEMVLIDEAARRIPIFQSGNMSLGILLLKQLARQAAQVLGEGFDIEIVEAHHNQKVDAPAARPTYWPGPSTRAWPRPAATPTNGKAGARRAREMRSASTPSGAAPCRASTR